MKLRARLVLFSIFLVAVVVAGTSITTLHFLKKLILNEIESSQQTVINNLKKVCEETLISRDDIFAYNYVNSLVSTIKGIAYATFVHSERQLILGKSEPFMAAMGGDENLIIDQAMKDNSNKVIPLPNGQRILHFSSEVRSPIGRVGAVYIGFYQDRVEQNIQESVDRITRIIIYVAGGAFAIGLIFALIFAISLTRPIYKLTQGAMALGEGNLDTQIDIKRKDEIGILADEFNIMAGKLKELDQLKDSFVSSVSHELRSPLTAISGYVELLTMKPVNELNPEKVTKALKIIQESAVRLTQFVNDVLDAAKIKAGKMEIHKSSFDVHATCESVMGLFMPLFQKKKLTPYTEIAPNAPATIFADTDKIRQVMTNLLSNGMKFTPEGGSITLKVLVDPAKPEFLRFSVTDTGCGIPKKYQHLLFGKFQQVPGSAEKASGAKGTGLGLVIAKGMVEGHGGQMWFESEEGQGTTFFFTLPLQAESGSATVESK